MAAATCDDVATGELDAAEFLVAGESAWGEDGNPAAGVRLYAVGDFGDPAFESGCTPVALLPKLAVGPGCRPLGCAANCESSEALLWLPDAINKEAVARDSHR